MEIDRLDAADVPGFVDALWIPAQRAFATHMPHTLTEDLSEAGRAYRRDLLEDDDALTLLAREVDTRLGYATAKIETPPPIFEQECTCRIDELYVAPDHRRRGVATALLEAVEDWATAQDCARLTLVVAADNDPAITLYERSGFTVDELHMTAAVGG